jgi:hypothetical protein
MSKQNDLGEALRDLMKSKGVGPQKLSSITDVPKRFLDAILQGDMDKLPPRPYIRGYLFKISNALGVDNDALWQIYMSSAETLSSGENDRLPVNRFAIKKLSPRMVVFILFGLLVVTFVGMNINRIIGKPMISVNVPETTDQQVLRVDGLIDPRDRLTLNGELIYTDEEGNFTKDVQMELGDANTLIFKVKRYLGRETTLIKRVVYQTTTNQTPTEQAITDQTTTEQNAN